MYWSPYRTERPYTGLSPLTADRCPVCGSTGGDCPGEPAPMPYPPFDPDAAAHTDAGGPLRPYTVTVRGSTTVMRLNDSDAARYGDAATLIL